MKVSSSCLNQLSQDFVRKVSALGWGLITFSNPMFAQQEWDIYLLGGQSNAEGRALNSGLPASLQGAQSDVMLFNGVNGSWGNLAPGTGGNSATGGNSSQFGPEVTLGRTLADDLPTRNIAIVKYGAGGTNLHTQWDPDTRATNEYDRFLTTVENAIAALPPGDTFTIKGMAWMQGESDAPAAGGNALNANSLAYQTNLTQFIASIRDEYELPNLPFVVGQLGHLKRVPNASANWTTVQDGQARTAALDPHTSMVVNSGLSLKDLVHYDAAGQQALGVNFAKAFQGQVNQLQVNNPSFEAFDLTSPDGDLNDNLDSTLISGWSEIGTSGSAANSDDTGTLLLSRSVYSSVSSRTIDGSNILSLVGDVAVEQSLSAVVEVGAIYLVTVSVGNRNAGSFQDFAGARIELLADGGVLQDSGAILSSDVVDGTFTDISFSYAAESTDSGILGIRLLSLNENAGSSSVDFDNVRIVKHPKLEITQFQFASEDTISLTWTSAPGASYTIETSSNLEIWSELVTQIDGANAPATSTTHVVNLPDPEPDHLFYRIQLK